MSPYNFTNYCTGIHPHTLIVKFFGGIQTLTFLAIDERFDYYYLIVNTKKIEEIIFDPGHYWDHSPILVRNTFITQHHSYNHHHYYYIILIIQYLGVHTWNVHVNSVCTRIQQ